MLLGPGNPHIGQPALLLHLCRVVDRLHSWEDALLHANEEDVAKLQALGRVHGHEHHTVLVGVKVVDIGIEGNLLQKAGEGRFLIFFTVSDNVGAKLLHVFQPDSSLISLGGKHEPVTGLFHDLVKEVAQFPRQGRFGKLLDHGGKRPQPRCFPGEGGIFIRRGKDIKKAVSRLQGDLLGCRHSGRADAPLGLVDDAV